MKKFLPKKLWLLRAYVSFLIGFTELLLSLYVIISIINFFSRKTLLGDFVLGLGGLYLVAVSLSILFVAQIILLFIGIHDNIDDMRKKALDENFTVDLVAEKEKENSNIIHSVFLIAVIVLSILFSILSLTGESTPFSPNEYINHSQNNVIENNKTSINEKKFDELYPILKNSLLKSVCEPFTTIDSKNSLDVLASSDVGIGKGDFLGKWSWEDPAFINKDIDNDGLVDYTIELGNSGGGCGGQVFISERWTLFGSSPNYFILTHEIPYRSETNEWIPIK